MADIVVNIELSNLHEPSLGFIADVTPPTVSDGTLTVANKTETNWDVQFTKATDDVTDQANLSYELYIADTSSLINDAETVRNNGTLEDSGTDVSVLSITGLDPQTQKFFNVVVEDERGNASIYDENSDTSFADEDAPTQSNDTLATSNVSTSGWDVDYTESSDNVTSQANIVYELYISDTNNLTTDASTVRTNGTLADTGTGVSTLTVAGLGESVQKYFNVVAEDEAGNASIYTQNSETTQTSGSAGSRSGDETALQDLYSSTNGPTDWSNTTGWSTSGMSLSDNIYGVTTATINGELRVTEIDLSGYTEENNIEAGNGLTGNINNTSLGNLTEMTLFCVLSNDITGQIPSSIGNCTSLEYLYLNMSTYNQDQLPHQEINSSSIAVIHNGKHDQGGGNKFTGTLPASIGNLSNLKYLVLMWGAITDYSDDIFDCTQLEGILLSFNDIQQARPLPSKFSNLTELKTIGFSSNRGLQDNVGPILNGSWPDMTGLTKLQDIDVNGCKLDGTPDFSNATNLRNAVLASNNLTGSFPSWVWDGSCPRLGGAKGFLCSHPDGYWPDGAGWTGTFPPYIEADFAASFAIKYHSMEGEFPAEFWTDNPGIIIFQIENNHITDLNLPNGNDMTNMNLIRLFRVADNELSGRWPNLDWGNVPDLRFASFAQNYYVFRDFLHQPSNGGGQTLLNLWQSEAEDYFSYSSQKPFGTGRSIDTFVGDDITLDDFETEVSHADNNYQWLKGGSSMSGETNRTMTISNAQESDSGTYTLQVTNPGASAVTLESAQIDINVE